MARSDRRSDARGTARDAAWREGHRLLEQRLDALPGALHVALLPPPPRLGIDPARVRRFVTTGIGSSAAHARLLATLLAEVGIAARFVPLTGLLAPPAGAARDALVVFSQGLSPNARLALRDVEGWRHVLLLTSVPERHGGRAAGGGAEHGAASGAEPDAAPGGTTAAGASPAGLLSGKQDLVAALVARGVLVQRFPGAEEYGTLLRVIGPATGAAAALGVARALAAAAGLPARGLLPSVVDADAVRARVAEARAVWTRAHPELDAAALEHGLALLASGSYGEVVANLGAKVLEGMLLPLPPVWDLLEFAHGPFQQATGRSATLLALTRADAAGEAEILERLAGMLDPALHRLVLLPARLPGVLALFEHEAMLDALVLRYLAAREIDQVRWPGKGRDGALYRLGAAEADLATPAPGADDAAPPRGEATPAPEGDAVERAVDAGSATVVPAPPATRRLERLAWPDVEALLAVGCRAAVLPLGSTEQHGPHLPLATDTLIAEAVAERLCARLPGTVRLPALALGCASEHLSFPGTLSLGEATLAAVLHDVGRSLAAHGFARLLVFSAHGGNYAALRAAAREVAPRLAPLELVAFTDLERLTAVLDGVAAAQGIDADAAGQHAGALETAILAWLAPGLVRSERLAPGLVGSSLAPGELFYPDLRRHAPDGTVGDPRPARAEHAEAYLDAWASLLAASLAGESADSKKRK